MRIRLFAGIIGLCLLASQISVQAQAQKKAGYKDPKVATSWGYLLPGAGHMYAGEGGKGLL